MTETAATISSTALGVRVVGLSHAYRQGTPVLRDISLDVQPGAIHCLLGPSGCGKTTLLRLIAGLERRQSGEIWIGEKCVADAHAHVPTERRSIGFVFQDFALFPHLTARQNVMFGMTADSRSQRRAEADARLEKVGLAGFETAMPHTLSGGQQQRVAVARALARRPAVMLMDEPFSGLDVALRAQVRETTIRVLRDERVPTIVVTHDPYEAAQIADRISVLRDGVIAAEGTPEELSPILINQR